MSAQTLSVADLAIDHALAQTARSMQFLLDVTPVNADKVRHDFAHGTVAQPSFHYRPLETSPEVLAKALENIDVADVEDATLGHLLRAKHRELGLQIEMLRARDTDDFSALSIELYGGATPELRRQADNILARVHRSEDAGDSLTAPEFLELAHSEIDFYREVDPEIDIHAEMRDDVNGVMVSGNTLLIDRDVVVQRARANALIQHEVGTHLVTQVNGAAQPVQVLGTGLAGYDRTQEGLAILAEIGCGELTPFRLRQLAARVLTVHRMHVGADFVEAWRALVDDGFPKSSAFTTTMRAYRSGGLSKDAIYLRGLVELLRHLRRGGGLDLLWLGKFSLEDLPLIRELDRRGVLRPPRLVPRYLEDARATERLDAAADHADDVAQLIEGAA
ncbi:flavohemoglobin expression-modulating QEGLA motif protein [Knoellia sp. CPCC 206453]|uniref:flavohemoglobin expression-modulating QEGLA motif protein n=1 Tax=Knoellia pratensis TaxID=3404796 RepID=UPI0036103E1C